MQTKEIIEKLFNLELESCYSSREDENPDEEFGHYEVYECKTNPLEVENCEPPMIKVYESGLVQLYHDAAPYPVEANTPSESMYMAQTLCEVPVRVERLTAWDWINFIKNLNEEYAD